MAARTPNSDRLKRSRKHEEYLQKLFGKLFPNVVRQPGSGNQATAPNDIKVQNELMIEAKCTNAMAIDVELSWLQRATRLALQFGLPACVAIRFCNTIDYDYFIISETQFISFMKLQRENDELRVRCQALARRV